jgi:aryl-alcohol dehydrogenase-like predicted oxidoreductase
LQYVKLGRTNLKVSRIGLGAMSFGSTSWRSWMIDEEHARAIIVRAYEAGINLFDTCDFYSAGVSEEILGRVLREIAPREEVVIATKVGNPMGPGPNSRGYSRKHILEAVDASLRRLGVDYLDLYQTHIWDPATDIDEMVAAFDHLVQSGKVLYVGAADMPAWQLSKAVHTARARGSASFDTFQHHYNALWREDEREHLPFCAAEGLGTLPYSPLARGVLADPRGAARPSARAADDEYAGIWYGREADSGLVAYVQDAAREAGVPIARLALAWVLHQQPSAAALFGATQVDHVDEAVAAMALTLDPATVAEIDRRYVARRIGGHQ